MQYYLGAYVIKIRTDDGPKKWVSYLPLFSHDIRFRFICTINSLLPFESNCLCLCYTEICITAVLGLFVRTAGAKPWPIMSGCRGAILRASVVVPSYILPGTIFFPFMKTYHYVLLMLLLLFCPPSLVDHSGRQG